MCAKPVSNCAIRCGEGTSNRGRLDRPLPIRASFASSRSARSCSSRAQPAWRHLRVRAGLPAVWSDPIVRDFRDRWSAPNLPTCDPDRRSSHRARQAVRENSRRPRQDLREPDLECADLLDRRGRQPENGDGRVGGLVNRRQPFLYVIAVAAFQLRELDAIALGLENGKPRSSLICKMASSSARKLRLGRISIERRLQNFHFLPKPVAVQLSDLRFLRGGTESSPEVGWHAAGLRERPQKLLEIADAGECRQRSLVIF